MELTSQRPGPGPRSIAYRQIFAGARPAIAPQWSLLIHARSSGGPAHAGQTEQAAGHVALRLSAPPDRASVDAASAHHAVAPRLSVLLSQLVLRHLGNRKAVPLQQLQQRVLPQA